MARRKSTKHTADSQPLLLLPSRAASLAERRTRPPRRHRRAKPPRQRTVWGLHPAAFAVTAAVSTLLFGVGLVNSITVLGSTANQPSETTVHNPLAFQQLRQLSLAVSQLESRQSQDELAIIDTAHLEQELANIQVDAESSNGSAAAQEISSLRDEVGRDQVSLAAAEQSAGGATETAAAGFDVPILFYHKPPTDFEQQMNFLVQRGYTSITLDQLAAAMTGRGPLPAKPVVITFDDGFSDQLKAVPILESHRLKATFFIITGGVASRYCIGANRIPGPCGDSYLNWDQIRQLDRNPLFTIASHTVDHVDLAQATPEVQRFEIFQGKQELEQQIGHQVDDFAYPYGAFNATTLALVRQAGFVAAVTTVPGTYQTASSLLSLRRIRSTYNLP